MQPADSFWDGVGRGLGESPWWAIVGGILIIGVLFIVARYVVPSRERIKMRELDIREREAINDEERIKANNSLAEEMRGLRISNDNNTIKLAEETARLNESAARSREMGSTVTEISTTTKRIDTTTKHTEDLVSDLHKHLMQGGSYEH